VLLVRENPLCWMSAQGYLSGAARFVSGNISWEEKYRLKYSDLIAVKTRDITSDFRNKRTYLFLLFSDGQICRLE